MSTKHYKSDSLKKTNTKKKYNSIRKIKSDNTHKSNVKIKPFLKKILDEKILEEKIKRMQHELSIIKRDKKDRELMVILEEINLLKYQSSVEIIINTLSEYIFSTKAKLDIFDKRVNSKIPHKTIDGKTLELQFIGSGAYGNVFKIIHNNNSSVLKVIKKTYKNLSVDIDRLEPHEKNEIQREIYILRTLSNIPNFLKFNSFIISKTRIFILMESFIGIPINRFLDRFSIITPKIQSLGIDNKDSAMIYLFKQISLSLYHMHQEFIVHNDLNKGNILVNINTLDYRILDFGLSICFGTKNKKLLVSKTSVKSKSVSDKKLPTISKAMTKTQSSNLPICNNINDKIKYPFSKGYSDGFRQMAPWRNKGCDNDGCLFKDLIRGDYWGLITLFEPFIDVGDIDTPYGEKKTSAAFGNDFPDIYKKITNEDIPDYIREDIQDDNQYLLFKKEVSTKYLWSL